MSAPSQTPSSTPINSPQIEVSRTSETRQLTQNELTNLQRQVETERRIDQVDTVSQTTERNESLEREARVSQGETIFNNAENLPEVQNQRLIDWLPDQVPYPNSNAKMSKREMLMLIEASGAGISSTMSHITWESMGHLSENTRFNDPNRRTINSIDQISDGSPPIFNINKFLNTFTRGTGSGTGLGFRYRNGAWELTQTLGNTRFSGSFIDFLNQPSSAIGRSKTVRQLYDKEARTTGIGRSVISGTNYQTAQRLNHIFEKYLGPVGATPENYPEITEIESNQLAQLQETLNTTPTSGQISNTLNRLTSALEFKRSEGAVMSTILNPENRTTIFNLLGNRNLLHCTAWVRQRHDRNILILKTSDEQFESFAITSNQLIPLTQLPREDVFTLLSDTPDNIDSEISRQEHIRETVRYITPEQIRANPNLALLSIDQSEFILERQTPYRPLQSQELIQNRLTRANLHYNFENLSDQAFQEVRVQFSRQVQAKINQAYNQLPTPRPRDVLISFIYNYKSPNEFIEEDSISFGQDIFASQEQLEADNFALLKRGIITNKDFTDLTSPNFIFDGTQTQNGFNQGLFTNIFSSLNLQNIIDERVLNNIQSDQNLLNTRKEALAKLFTKEIINKIESSGLSEHNGFLSATLILNENNEIEVKEIDTTSSRATDRALEEVDERTQEQREQAQEVISRVNQEVENITGTWPLSWLFKVLPWSNERISQRILNGSNIPTPVTTTAIFSAIFGIATFQGRSDRSPDQIPPHILAPSELREITNNQWNAISRTDREGNPALSVLNNVRFTEERQIPNNYEMLIPRGTIIKNLPSNVELIDSQGNTMSRRNDREFTTTRAYVMRSKNRNNLTQTIVAGTEIIGSVYIRHQAIAQRDGRFTTPTRTTPAVTPEPAPAIAENSTAQPSEPNPTQHASTTPTATPEPVAETPTEQPEQSTT